MVKTKKSQATVFMIVGVVLLIGLGIFFYMTQKSSTLTEPEIKIVQEQIPVEFDPIRKYGTDCAYSVALEGLKTIGRQGGYISLSNSTLNTEPFTVTPNPTESDAVSFSEDSELKVPYWWYMKSGNECQNNCMFTSKRPDLRQSDNSIEKQLERYLETEFETCLNNFEPFLQQGYEVTKTGETRSDVTIAENDVVVLVEYPISARKQDAKADLRQFMATMPVNLARTYELATKITNMQIQHNYLEKHLLNLIVAFSGTDNDKLPPMSEMQFKFGSTASWQKTDIKNKVTGMLASHTQLFQVDGTSNYQRNIFDSELKQRLYDAAIIPVANESFSNFEAYFTYLDFWPVYFDLNCKGERCVPSSSNTLLSLVGVQDYRFAYDVSFPVLVEIKDNEAFKGDGYSFQFFLEGNIRNNRHMQANFTLLEPLAYSERSQLCDLRTSGNITINIADSVTKSPLEDAHAVYKVIDESCFIGSTDIEGVIIEPFPVSIGGTVTFLKEGYVGKTAQFDAKPDLSSALDITLDPIYTKNIIIRKKNVVKKLEGQNFVWEFEDKALDLSEKEQATVTLTRAQSENDMEFSSVAQYKGKQAEKTEMRIAPGTYEAEISLLLSEAISVPERRKCVSKGFLLGKECFDIPAMNFSQGFSKGSEKFPSGGLKMSLNINPQDLSSRDTIIFYVVNIDIANVPEEQRVVQDIEQINKIEEYSRTYQLVLQPTFE